MRAARETRPPRPDVSTDSNNARIAIDEHNIDGVAHSERVDARARRNQQSLGRFERSAHQQTQSAGDEPVSHSDAQRAAGGRAILVDGHHRPAFSN
jgi:hypothetical protein